MEIKTLTDLWPMFLAFIGFVVWLVRLEMSVKNNKEEIRANEATKIVMGTRLQIIEDKYHGHNREIGEMKQLLFTTNSMVTQIHAKMFHDK